MPKRDNNDARASAAPASSDHPVSQSGRAIVVGPYLRRASKHDDALAMRDPQARLDEATGLALAIDLDIRAALIAPLGDIRPATYLGKGKVEEVAAQVKEHEAGLVIMDCALSPIQQRNLEKEMGCKVLDRTGLILEIFGRRAKTKEGALQVELAHLKYQRSRLVRSWTHLERQRGGFGFLGGPGETQIEADRRLIGERIVRIENDLKKVQATRRLHRAGRERVPYRMVALVGYTNAGKSTLFNALTRARVQAEDMLFATLDPTLRLIRLPHGGKAMLSDTVGFISDLPTMLVAAFRATLEEVVQADVIVHVRDLSHEDAQAQQHDVEDVLRQLDIDTQASGRMIEVWNKIDKLDEAARENLVNIAARQAPQTRPVLVSALTGDGIADLLEAIETQLALHRIVLQIDVAAGDGEGMSWLHRHGEVLTREPHDDRVRMRVRFDESREAGVLQKYPGAIRLAHE